MGYRTRKCRKMRNRLDTRYGARRSTVPTMSQEFKYLFLARIPVTESRSNVRARPIATRDVDINRHELTIRVSGADPHLAFGPPLARGEAGYWSRRVGAAASGGTTADAQSKLEAPWLSVK
jgi:hypothetical protein